MIKKSLNLLIRSNFSKLPKRTFGDIFGDREKAEEKNYILR